MGNTRRRMPGICLTVLTLAGLVFGGGTASATVGRFASLPMWIAFSRTDVSGTHIYKVWYDGTQLSQLTDRKAQDSQPAFSPDGSTILFTRTIATGSSIWSMDADGSNQTKLIANASDAVWNRTGDRIAFVRPGRRGSHIWTADATNGLERTRLTSGPEDDTQPVWDTPFTLTPDEIAFVSDRTGRPQVYVMDADGSDQHAVAPQDAAQSSPTWGNPNEVVFVSDLSGLHDLWHAPRAGGTASELDPSESHGFQASIEVGTALALVRRTAGGNSHIVYEQYDGGAIPATPVTPIGDHIDRDPSWIGAEAWDAAYDAHAQENLTAVADSAQSIRDSSGSFVNADARGLENAVPPLPFPLDFVERGVASVSNYSISVDAETTTWAGEVLSESGTCFWLRISDGFGRAYASAHPTCDGAAAQGAADPSWPAS